MLNQGEFAVRESLEPARRIPAPDDVCVVQENPVSLNVKEEIPELALVIKVVDEGRSSRSTIRERMYITSSWNDDVEYRCPKNKQVIFTILPLR